MAGPSSYMFVAAILFLIGAVGVVVRRDLIVILMAVEIMLNAVNLQFLAFARQLGQSEGQVLFLWSWWLRPPRRRSGLLLSFCCTVQGRRLTSTTLT